jgi:hypothetical protein
MLCSSLHAPMQGALDTCAWCLTAPVRGPLDTCDQWKLLQHAKKDWQAAAGMILRHLCPVLQGYSVLVKDTTVCNV